MRATSTKRKSRTKKHRSKARAGARGQQPLKGKRFSEEQRRHALLLVVSGMGREQVAKTVGTTTESIRRWVNRARADGTMPTPPTVPEGDDTATVGNGDNGSAGLQYGETARYCTSLLADRLGVPTSKKREVG